uniref:hypothetical protein n=1 Tax=Roseobacter sp. HKCCA0434 TaxID=3079297 RepID=UPI002905C353
AGAAAGAVVDRRLARVPGVEYIVRRAGDGGDLVIAQELPEGDRPLPTGGDCRVRTDSVSGTGEVLPPLEG